MSIDDEKPEDLLNAEDRELWENYTQSIEPFKKDKNTQKKGSKKTEDHSAKPMIQPMAQHGASEKELIDFDRKIFRQIKSGKTPINAKLDLHGYTQKEAFALLEQFISSCFSNGKRITIIITGKGAGNRGESLGILRRNLPYWLNHPTLKPYVLSFCQSDIKHGGAGAFYVIIRKK